MLEIGRVRVQKRVCDTARGPPCYSCSVSVVAASVNYIP